jgi:hypothetical protein
MPRGDSRSHELPRLYRLESGSGSVPQLRHGRDRWQMDRGSGTSLVKEMGRREVGNLPVGLMSFRAVMIPGRVVMFVVITIR